MPALLPRQGYERRHRPYFQHLGGGVVFQTQADHARNPHGEYEIIYPAPGHSELAERIAALLEASDIPTHLDPQRSFDHGAFIPLKLMYPEADIPTL